MTVRLVWLEVAHVRTSLRARRQCNRGQLAAAQNGVPPWPCAMYSMWYASPGELRVALNQHHYCKQTVQGSF